jgi:hypothetical protein
MLRDLWKARPPNPLVREVLAQDAVQRLVPSLRRDGTWGSWLHRGGLSSENAVTRLSELGCPFDRAPFARALPPLLALLQGKPTPFLDLRQPASPITRERLRRVAAGLLCHAGLADAEEVEEAVEREVDRAHRWVVRARTRGLPLERRESDSRPEWVYLPDALDPDGLGVPDLYWLRAVAFSPAVARDPRVREVVQFVRSAPYQRLAAEGLGLLAVEGRRVRPGFGVRCLEPDLAASEGRMGEALVAAELLARAGEPDYARRMIRFLNTKKSTEGRVALPAGAFRREGGYLIQGGSVRISAPWRAGARSLDLTFRTLLLAQISAASGAVPG